MNRIKRLMVFIYYLFTLLKYCFESDIAYIYIRQAPDQPQRQKGRLEKKENVPRLWVEKFWIQIKYVSHVTQAINRMIIDKVLIFSWSYAGLYKKYILYLLMETSNDKMHNRHCK